MANVEVPADVRQEIRDLPAPIVTRVTRLLERLTNSPHVSGAKPLRRDRSARYRLRTGDYRLQFRVQTHKRTMRPPKRKRSSTPSSWKRWGIAMASTNRTAAVNDAGKREAQLAREVQRLRAEVKQLRDDLAAHT